MFKLQKLETYAKDTGSAVTELATRLANAYLDLGHDDKAEQQYKRILLGLEKQYGS